MEPRFIPIDRRFTDELTTIMSTKKSDLPLVPETILKKRHDLDDLVRKRAAAAEEARKERGGSGILPHNKGDGKNNSNKTIYVKKPETILARAISRRNNQTRYRRVLKKGMQKRASDKPVFATKVLSDDGDTVQEQKFQSNSFGAPMVFVIRIRDGLGAPKSVRQTLSRLRLRNLHQGVFVRYDETHRKMLHLVEPWVVYGPPTKAVVSDLVERRGYGRIDGKRVPLSDNNLIEEALGEFNIVCKEDLVHELCQVEENFGKAAAFLWPFHLSDNKTTFERRTLKLKDGKDYGDRGEAITEYIQAVL